MIGLFVEEYFENNDKKTIRSDGIGANDNSTRVSADGIVYCLQ